MSGAKRQPKPPWQERVFTLWLRLIPSRFAPPVQDDIVQLFGDRIAELKTQRDRTLALARAAADALVHARSPDFDRAVRPQQQAFPDPPAARPRQRPTSRGASVLDSLLQDLRFAIRSLRSRPTFSTLAILALALGIGGTTAMFSVVDGVLFKALPYRDADRIVSVWKAWPSWEGQEGVDYTWDHIQFPWVDYLEVRESSRTLETVAAHAQATAVLTGSGGAAELSVGEASANLFEMLGVAMVAGRPFALEEAAPDGAPAPVAILSHSLWSQRFGADPEVIGRVVLLGTEPFTVVGVLAPNFRMPSDLISTHSNQGKVDPGQRDIWLPLGTNGTDRGNSFELLARLAPGMTPEQARDEVQTLMTHGEEDQIARVEPRKAFVTKGFARPLGFLLGAAAILLLIACINVMGLLLGEAAGRQRELTVRQALGATSSRIVRQLLTESVLLGLAGSGLGLLLAWLGTDALLGLGPKLPRLEQVGLDLRVLLFACAAGLGTGILFGTVPAVNMARSAANERLRSRGASRNARLVQSWSLSAQVALTLVLLVVGSLFGRSLMRVMSAEPGFETASLETWSVRMPPGDASRDQRFQFLESTLETVRGVAGVQAVSAARNLPFAGGTGTQSLAFERQGEAMSIAQAPMFVHPGYFDTLEIPVLQGRRLRESDRFEAEGVMVLSRSAADQIWPDEAAVGQLLRFRGSEWTVVGVVGDVLHQSLSEEPRPTFYASAFQVPQSRFNLIARVADPAAAAKIERALLTSNPDAALSHLGAMKTLVIRAEADSRFRALLVAVFAVLATLLAAVGLFGATSRAVASRSRELGIRAALGATAQGLQALILREGVRCLAVGLVLGLVGAGAAARGIGHLLFQIRPSDPQAYLVSTFAISAACLIAAWIPARRVSRIEPREVMIDD